MAYAKRACREGKSGLENSTTSKSKLLFNPYIAALPPYNAGMNIAMARALSGHQDIARLASNETPDGCSPNVMKALASPSFEPWRYADPACTALRAALGEKVAIDPGLIVVGN